MTLKDYEDDAMSFESWNLVISDPVEDDWLQVDGNPEDSEEDAEKKEMLVDVAPWMVGVVCWGGWLGRVVLASSFIFGGMMGLRNA